MSASEMIERVGVIAAAGDGVPLIADGDNGHGGPLNTAKLTRAYERAGAAAIQLEDQVLPSGAAIWRTRRSSPAMRRRRRSAPRPRRAPARRSRSWPAPTRARPMAWTKRSRAARRS
ncbi:MAG: hypothetical protein WDM81_14390 [Rhizomicrobium sp.]